MEIFTSFIFWIIVVIIIVLLGIIGYLAEGTILANKKKQEEKPKKGNPENTEDTWLKDAPSEEEKRQEVVYKTANDSWLEMPDVAPNNESINEDKDDNSTMLEVNNSQTDSIFTAQTSETPAQEISSEHVANESVNTLNTIPEENNEAGSADNLTTPVNEIPDVTTEPIISNNTVEKVDNNSQVIPEINNQNIASTTTNENSENKNAETLDIWK